MNDLNLVVGVFIIFVSGLNCGALLVALVFWFLCWIQEKPTP